MCQWVISWHLKTSFPQQTHLYQPSFLMHSVARLSALPCGNPATSRLRLNFVCPHRLVSLPGSSSSHSSTDQTQLIKLEAVRPQSLSPFVHWNIFKRSDPSQCLCPETNSSKTTFQRWFLIGRDLWRAWRQLRPHLEVLLGHSRHKANGAACQHASKKALGI